MLKKLKNCTTFSVGEPPPETRHCADQHRQRRPELCTLINAFLVVFYRVIVGTFAVCRHGLQTNNQAACRALAKWLKHSNEMVEKERLAWQMVAS